MQRWIAPVLCVLAMSVAGRSAAASCPPQSTIAERVFGGGLCLVAATFGAEHAGPSPVLIVIVHGDISDFGPATYHATFAASLVRPGVVVVALTRPGYGDANGATSQGSTLGRIDNYTSANIGAIEGAVDALKKHYRPRRTVYVGHSGGAAIGGVLIGRRPNLVDAALLVSCPCDIPRWLQMRGYKPWKRSLSPDAFVHRVPTSTEVVLMTGANDDNTFPSLADDYAQNLARRGVPARFLLVEGAAHGFSTLADATRDAVLNLAIAP
jgi:pimeloyl-ACP methyl ester carboxylesterase